jgi:hypothetical protein
VQEVGRLAADTDFPVPEIPALLRTQRGQFPESTNRMNTMGVEQTL